ncbi:hypothetical protein QR680_016756 [Steinernema hermaphroditum]|uniref:Protein kinase domain-containing protein n=1 Tax=Steinernema hermaphroditum TaxID=289476 RepID=A0AA39HC71_9BILA|nr:hypothetical protein QR680_016756 [Steinernema hermaphroditum]
MPDSKRKRTRNAEPSKGETYKSGSVRKRTSGNQDAKKKEKRCTGKIEEKCCTGKIEEKCCSGKNEDKCCAAKCERYLKRKKQQRRKNKHSSRRHGNRDGKKKDKKKKQKIKRSPLPQPPSPSPSPLPPPPPPPSPNIPDTSKTSSTRKEAEKLRFDAEKKLLPGAKIAVPNIEVTVLKLLGEGGFGQVYLVRDSKENRYAMKTEYMREGISSRIKMEVKAYDKIAKYRKEHPKSGIRLLGFFGSGAIDNLKFFIMSLVGPSVDSLVTKYEISFGTALRLCIEMFNGIVDLHTCGFVHRDIKPENYAIGLNADRRRVYLVDLGMVVRIIEESDRMPTSSKYDFIGTQLYAPRTSHLGNVQTQRDDLESWIYSCVDLFAPNKLPWAYECDRQKAGDLKDEFFKNPPSDILSQIPAPFEEIMRKVNMVSMMQKPDYKAIRDLLDNAAKMDEIDFDEPFEWELAKQPKPKDDSAGKKKDISEKLDRTQLTIVENEVAGRVVAG